MRVGTDLPVHVVESPENGRYQLTDEDRRKSVSAEARARRRQTLRERREARKEAVLWLHEQQRLVPEAIADYLGVSDGQVYSYLREAKWESNRS